MGTALKIHLADPLSFFGAKVFVTVQFKGVKLPSDGSFLKTFV
jgi:hypothetical protein